MLRARDNSMNSNLDMMIVESPKENWDSDKSEEETKADKFGSPISIKIRKC